MSEGIVLFDRDLTEDVAYTIALDADGQVHSTNSTAAIAGPWVHDGKIWWQPDEGTLCAGAVLGEATERHELPAEHAGPGRLLRLTGRTLFLPWHGVTILDLAPTKKGKTEISRKHKAADEPLYRAASQLLAPIQEMMAPRGVRVEWIGVVRSGRQIEPKANIIGKSDLVTHLLQSALQRGAKQLLAQHGVTNVSASGGTRFDEVLSAPTSVGDLRMLTATLDAVGIDRTLAFNAVDSLRETAKRLGRAMPWTPEVEALAMAIAISGLRGEVGAIPPATASALEEATSLLADTEALFRRGIDSISTAKFLAVCAHEHFGAEAAAPLLRLLESKNPHFAQSVHDLLGLAYTPPVIPAISVEPLSTEEALAYDALRSALTSLGIDPEASREGRAWTRFTLDDVQMQAGVNEDVRVVATLCATETDVDLRKLSASLKRANRTAGLARFIESDCYIHASARSPRTLATVTHWKAMIEACRDAVQSETGRALASQYLSTE